MNKLTRIVNRALAGKATDAEFDYALKVLKLESKRLTKVPRVWTPKPGRPGDKR